MSRNHLDRSPDVELLPLDVLYSFSRVLGRSGVGTTAYNQARGLLTNGLSVQAVVKEAERMPDGLSIVKTMPATGVHIPHRLLRKRELEYHDIAAARALWRMRHSPPLAVHGWPGGCARTFTVARRLGVRTVREAPNCHIRTAATAVLGELERLGMTAVTRLREPYTERWIRRYEEEYRLADIILTPSAAVRESFLQHGVPPEKLIFDKYGFDDTQFSVPTGTAKDDAFIVCCIARMDPRKGLHYALAAWLSSGVANHGRFIICGTFDPAYQSALRDLLRHPSVEIRGYVPDPADLLRSSDALILASVEEGSALVTYEALACGCALLVSSACGACLTHGREGFVHRVGDVGELASQIRILAEDVLLRRRMQSAAALSSRAFSWEAAGKDLADTYRTAILPRFDDCRHIRSVREH